MPIFTKGEYPDGRKVSTQGVLPFEVQYIEKAGDKKFATKPTGLATGIPTVYNADTLGVLAECGYSMAFNTVRREIVFGQDPRYELPRFDTRDVARAYEVPASA